ncbi:MAG TPA: ATPase, T2SS/T4P/T4SS family, partial [Phycisphaerae bacterium]|nr:ATPase, T2SS/T4P/T4SS family [Phycisphaerae bacterium]
MKSIHDVLTLARQRRAADVHLIAGAPVLFRIERELVPVTKEKLSRDICRELAYSLLSAEQITQFEADLDYDFMFADKERNRHRVNICYNDGAVGAVIRLLPSEPIPLDVLQLPPIVAQLTLARKGLILLTGSTSQGKTTTMSAMIDSINVNARKHIVTIEDPIEYVHTNKNSIVRQREVGKDTSGFSRGLRAALRQD